jgi:hypothetical protein
MQGQERPTSYAFIHLFIIHSFIHEICNGNGVGAVNFATSKHLIVKNAMFPYRNIHKFTSTSDRGTQSDPQYFIDRRQHSTVLDIRSFSGADCDTDHYLVMEKFRERLAANKWKTQKFDIQSFNLNKVGGEKQYRIEISNSFATLENLMMMWILTALGKLLERISKFLSLDYYELKEHKPWFGDGCSKILYQRKQAKLQRSQDPSQIHGNIVEQCNTRS